MKRGGGLFGANPLTGSIGVVTVNLPRIGYETDSREAFLARLDERVVTAHDSLVIKRKVLEKFTEKDLYPYAKFYLRSIKENSGRYWKNHFSTIGIVGMNEACLNLLGRSIASGEGQRFALKVMDHLRETIAHIQEATGDMINLEATPAEGTSYRLALKDKQRYPDIVCANEDGYRNGAAPFYTNSTQLPVDHTEDVYETLLLQDALQTKYTGGTVLHLFLGEQVDNPAAVRQLVRKITTGFRLPYFTLTPTFSVCPTHGYLKGSQETCEICGHETEVYSRVVGYLRPINQWNAGKQAEYGLRKNVAPAFEDGGGGNVVEDAPALPLAS
jgi:ribonucleoside-triphosphate reductase